MRLMKYKVWVTLFGSSAENAGIICSRQSARAEWKDGRSVYVPINDGSQQGFEFEAVSDDRAFAILTQLFNEQNPANRKPISGKSYLRQCRPAMKRKAS